MIEDERPNVPEEEGTEQGGEPEDEQPAAGDEDLTSVEDETEEVSEAPEGEATEPEATEPEAEAPQEPAQADQEERPKRERRGRGRDKGGEEEVIPGAHLAPDLVLEEERQEAEFGEFGDADSYVAPAEGEPAAAAEAVAEEPEAEAPAERPASRSVVDLAADARYQATGKRKRSIARVVLRPGDGAYSVNGRSLEDYFPRAALQNAARQPLATAGFEKRMDVVARIHGGGISAQAGALRHGVARALVEADPSLRIELKRRGFLSRDARVKERKKAGLKKARKRPQFSKR